MVNRVDVDFENDSIKIYLVLSDKSMTKELDTTSNITKLYKAINSFP